jgi:hypothetical protein
MAKALSINPDISLEDIVEINARRDFTVAYSPLLKRSGAGPGQGGTIIRRVGRPDWTGVKRRDGESVSEYASRLQSEYGDAFDNYASAVPDAVQTSNEVANQLGENENMAVVERNGQIELDTAFGGKRAEREGNAEVLSTHESFEEAMQSFQAQGGQMTLPQVA